MRAVGEHNENQWTGEKGYKPMKAANKTAVE